MRTLTRACLVSVYSDIHSGRPLERVPRLASAHRAALARPSATHHKHPPECPRGAALLATRRRVARDTNQRQLLGSIEHDALLRCIERPLGAPHMRWPPSRGALRLLYTHRTPSRRVPLARRPPAAAAASPPLTRARLISAYSEMHSGRPLERAPRLARAHHAALARPLSQTGTLSSALGALHRPRRAAVWRATQTRDGCSGRSSTTLYFAVSGDPMAASFRRL